MVVMPTPAEWSALCPRVATVCPYQLATLLEVDWDAQLVRRRYSSDEKNYPSGGVKRLMGSSWARHVLEQGKVLFVRGPDEMKDAFADHELLHSLGLEQALNIPVQSQGRVFWTLNLLRQQPAFNQVEAAAIKELLQAWQPLGYTPFLPFT